LNSTLAKKIVGECGFNPALSFAFLDAKGSLVAANRRMLDLLKKRVAPKLPVAAEKFSELWTFHTEELGPGATLKRALQASRESLVVQHKLKTYKLHFLRVKNKKFEGSLIVAELQRPGDLLKDRVSRQELFRNLSHEVRTAVQAVRGYVGMLEADKPVSSGVVMGFEKSLERLEGVVKRLQDLKSEFEVLDEGRGK
jgi:signal transduction histidine kinase